MDLILYHNACPDGWAAAYVCKKKYPEAELLPLNHGLSEIEFHNLLVRCAEKDVIMVDYSLRTRELNDRLNSAAESVRILDHHKTALAALDGATYATFDMKRSGAGLAWDYLFGKDSPQSGTLNVVDPFKLHRPWWVSYTEDQDLWNWALPDSQTINAFLMVQPRDVETWDNLTKLDVNEAAQYGVGVREYIEYYTRSVIAELQPGVLRFQTGSLESEDGLIVIPTYADYFAAVLNIPYAGVSEAGNAAVKLGFDVAVLWFERGDGVIQFSLRSNRDGSNVDVSAIAKKYGGGGHQNAAGFQVSIPEGRALVDQILARKADYVPPRCG